MPETRITKDPKGAVTATEIEPQQITVSFERANTEFGNGPKAGIHVRVPVDANATDAEVSNEVFRWGKFAQEYVDAALKAAGGPTFSSGGSRGGGSRPVGGSKGGSSKRPRLTDDQWEARKAEAWADLEANPDNWYDNRNDPDKPPKGPDYKGKPKTEFEGLGLWEDSRP